MRFASRSLRDNQATHGPPFAHQSRCVTAIGRSPAARFCLVPSQKVVKLAVSQNPKALHLASSRLKSNVALVLDLVRDEPHVIQFADDALWDNKEIMMTVVQRWGRGLTFASEDLQDDMELVLTAIQQDPQAVEDASETLRNNKAVMMAAVEKAIHPFGLPSFPATFAPCALSLL